MKDFNISTSLVVLPFFHLLLASTYVYAYCFGFGANVATFVGASDIFTTSIRNLAPIYGIVAVIAFLSVRPHIGHWMTSLSPIPERFGPWRPSPSSSIFPRVMGILLGIVVTKWMVTSYLTGEAIDIHFIVMSLVGLLLLHAIAVPFRPTLDVTMVVFAIAVVVATVTFGLNSGQRDRHANHIEQARSNVVCKDYIVLRRFSEMYLVIGKDDRHRLVDRNAVPKSISWLFW